MRRRKWRWKRLPTLNPPLQRVNEFSWQQIIILVVPPPNFGISTKSSNYVAAWSQTRKISYFCILHPVAFLLKRPAPLRLAVPRFFVTYIVSECCNGTKRCRPVLLKNFVPPSSLLKTCDQQRQLRMLLSDENVDCRTQGTCLSHL